MAGPVAKTPNFTPGSLVACQWGKKCKYVMVAPMIAPIICARIYSGTSPHGKSPLNASPNVTAGFKCAPLNCPTAYTLMATPNPHPNVMTIQPALYANDFFKFTLAQTPAPKIMSNAVPTTSPINAFMHHPSFQLDFALNHDEPTSSIAFHTRRACTTIDFRACTGLFSSFTL